MSNVEEAREPEGSPRFEVYEDEAGKWRWRLVSANGKTVIPPEDHRDSTDAVRAIRSVERILDERPDVVIKRTVL